MSEEYGNMGGKNFRKESGEAFSSINVTALEEIAIVRRHLCPPAL